MSPRAKMALMALLCGLQAAPALGETQAVLKLQIRLDSGVIKVSDLWADAGAKSDMVVGLAPPPGRSIAIEAAQLGYIAHLFDVDWQPLSGVERTSVERVGRALTREEMAEPIRRSLVDAGAAATSTVEFANFMPIEVPPLSFPLIAVEGIAYDRAAEQFSANLVATAEGMQTQRMRVAGRVMQMVTAVVALRRLQPGTVIAAADVKLSQVAARRLATPPITDLSQVVGQSMKRAIVAGQALSAADVGPPVMVAKGDTVVIMLDTPGMSLAAQGLALAAGGRDDVIEVMNPLSRAVVAARITGPGRAVITPGSAPLVAPANAANPAPE